MFGIFIFFAFVFAVAFAQTIPRTERLLPISITESSNNDYGYTIKLAKDTGMQVTGSSLK